MENECQWENCSGGRYCPKHSLESQQNKHTPIEGIVEEFEERFIEKPPCYANPNSDIGGTVCPPFRVKGTPHDVLNYLRTTLKSQADQYEREKGELVREMIAKQDWLGIGNGEQELAVTLVDIQAIAQKYGVDLSEPNN